jgi:ankyrin repeat protein
MLSSRFLWVVCQVKYLRTVLTTITPNTVKALPGTLERTFEQTFTKLNAGNQALAKRILRFVMFSNRPLDLAELVEGIAINRNTRTLRDMQREKVRNENYVLEICGSLVRKSESTGRVELSHYSVYEFLNSPRLEDGRENGFYLNRLDSVSEILTACVNYLGFSEVYTSGLVADLEQASKDGSDVDPLLSTKFHYLDYAARNWCLHVAQASDDGIRKIWEAPMVPFLRSKEHFDFWVRISRYIYGSYKYPEGMSALHVCALHGLNLLARRILQDPLLSHYWPETASDGRLPLHVAIENGHDDMIELFLDTRGPQTINAVDKEGRTPLHTAIEAGSSVAVAKLTTAGADVNAVSEADGRTPVAIAIENSWDTLASLLSVKADPSRCLPDGRTLLHLAAQTGSQAWTNTLLESHRTILNETDEIGWTALHYAVDRGHEQVASMLVARGAWLALEDRQNRWTPLHAAVRHNRKGCTRLLLTSRNALREGVHPGNAQVRQSVYAGTYRHLILTPQAFREEEQRRSQDYQHKYGDLWRHRGGGSSSAAPSPLLLAVSNCWLDGVGLLLQNPEPYGRHEIGFDSMAECLEKALALIIERPAGGESSQGAIDLAGQIFDQLVRAADTSTIIKVLPQIASRDTGVVMSILQRNWPTNFVYDEVFPYVLQRSLADCLKFLLEGWPPSAGLLPRDTLHVAVCNWKGDLHCVGLLIDADAELLHTGSNLSPLQTAIQEKNWDIGEFFIGKGMRDPGSSLLHAIVVETGPGDDDIRKGIERANRLLEKGVKIDGIDTRGRSICHKAAMRPDSQFLSWALQKGATPDLADVDGDSPVHVATKLQYFLNLQLLLNQIVEAKPHVLLTVLSSKGSQNTPVVFAIEHANKGILEVLLEAERAAFLRAAADDDENDENKRNTMYTDAICSAIKNDFGDGLSLLMNNTDDICWKGSDGQTPLHVAAQGNSPHFVEMLLANGAEVFSTTREGKTPYSLALEKGNDAILNKLDQYGARPQPQDLIIAAKLGNVVVADRILTSHPQDRVTQRTALYQAREHGKNSIVELLLTRVGERLNTRCIDGFRRDPFGDTILHTAVRSNDATAIADILRGARDRVRLLSARDEGGYTALIVAVMTEHWRSAEVLAANGADLRATLRWASSQGRMPWVTKLQELIVAQGNSSR